VSAIIYKVCSKKDWSEACAAGTYTGSNDDRRDSFIHFSTAEQLPGTLARHFAGRGDLVLIAYAVAALGGNLKWEASRGGALFPHYYGTLDPALASWAKPIAQTASGFGLATLLYGASA
jgi:uncharacterized protein (DUF952 family)